MRISALMLRITACSLECIFCSIIGNKGKPFGNCNMPPMSRDDGDATGQNWLGQHSHPRKDCPSWIG